MAELRYTYLLDVKDRASRAVTTANERIARSAATANRAMEKQGAVAQSASRQIQSAGARQAAEWKQVARAAQTAERSVAQSATQASTSVSKALERQVAAQRKAGASYAQIARAQKAAGASARETAAAIEQSAAREQKAMTASSGAARKHSGVLGGLRSQLKGFGGMAAGLGATFAAFKGLDFLRESVNDVESLARSTIKLQKITGQDATTASSWIQVAKQRGLTAQQLSRAFVTLEKNQVKGAAGAKTQAEAFRTLGISQEQLKRSNPQQLILAVADGMKNLENPSKRAAAAQALFGRAGVSLIATLSGGSQAIRDQLEVVQKYGASLDKNGVKNAMKLVAEQRKLSLAMDGVKLSIGQALVPLLARGAKALATFVLQMRQGTGAGGAVRRVFEQMAQGAAGVWSAVGPAVKALAGLVRQHPGLVKVAGAFVAIGLAVRGLRFASAVSGATSLLGLLTRIGAKRGAVTGVLAGGGAGGAAGAAAGIKVLAVRLTGLVGVYAVARAAVDKFTAKMTASSNPVVSAYGKVQNVVQRLGRAFMGDRQGLTDYFQALFGGASKASAKLRQTAADAAQVASALGRMRGRQIAQSFATEAASAGNVTVGMIRRVTASLGQLKGDTRREARLAMRSMLAQLVAGGKITAAQAAKMEHGIAAQFGPLKDDLGSAARRGIRAITREFGALPGGITNPLRLSLTQTRTYMGRIINVVNATTQQLRTMRALLAQGIEPTSPRSIGGGHRPANGSHGGILGRRGFRRYQAGGMVPAMVSPGEMIVHQGRAGMVPGHPVAADNVAMMLPVGAAVLTGDGQRMVSQGATIGQAIARQAPHYATGGWVRTGATVDPSDQAHQSPPGRKYWNRGISYAELGSAGANAAGGFMARLLGRKVGGLGLPFGFGVEVRVPHGRRSARVFKSDVGSGQKGDRFYTIDLHAQAARAIGFTAGKGPVEIRPLTGGTTTGGRPAYSTYAPRGRLITSGRAMQLGYQAGLEGGSLYPVYASVRDAVTYNRTDHPAVAGTPRGGGGGGGGAGRGPDYGGRTGPMVTFQGKRMRSWLAHALAYARDKGWRGHVVEGLRSIAEQRRLWNGAPGNGLVRGVSVARPGTSNHQTGNAVDVAPAGPGLLRYLRGYRGHKPQWRGPTDRPHYSWNGHRRGGIIGARRFQGGGLVGPGSAVAPRDPLPRYQPGMPMTTGPSVVGPATLQSTRGGLGRLVGVEMTAYQKTVRMVAAAQRALLKAGAHDNQAIATALHAIDVGIQRVHQVSYGRLEKMAKQLKSAIATTKDPDVARRLKGELRLVFGEMGRRIGLLAKEAADMVDPATRAAVHVERLLKASKGRIDMTTTAALGGLERATNVSEATLRAAIGKLQAAYQRAAKSGLKGAMHTLAGQIADLMTQLGQVMADAAQAAADAAAAVRDAARTRFDQQIRAIRAGLQLTGVDPGSPTGLGGEVKIQDATTRFLAGQKKDLQNQWFLAPATQRGDILAQIQELDVQIQESAAASADFARQQAAAVRQQAKEAADDAAQARQDAADRAAQAAQDAADRREAERQAAIDAATSRVSLAQGGLQTLELQQRLAGTYDQGGRARADYITSTIIPAIQAEIKTLQARGASAEDIQRAQNDLLQEQLDAQDAIKQNTADAAESLAKLGGTLGFEFQGSRLTDDLLASGVGA